MMSYYSGLGSCDDRFLVRVDSGGGEGGGNCGCVFFGVVWRRLCMCFSFWGWCVEGWGCEFGSCRCVGGW